MRIQYTRDVAADTCGETNRPHATLMGMKILRSYGVVAAMVCVGMVSVGCASSAGGGGSVPDPGDPTPALSLTDAVPGLPDGDVLGQGTVIDVAGDVQLCLGGVMESFPPQCTGVPLVGWDWADVDGSETSGDVTWGVYAVQGTYDGDLLTVTQPPILLALFDPKAPDDPTNGEPGPADEATLTRVQTDVHDALGARALSSWPQEGRLWVQVVWDDGTVQDAADATFGDDVVLIQSSLNEVG